MGFLSNLRGGAFSSKNMRGMGSLGARPDLPKPPGGGGFLKRAARNFGQQIGQTMTPGIENLDSRAIEADPEGFETFLRAAQEQETLMPGSTFLGEQQKFEQDMAQQLLPPPPGFVPPTIGNTGGSGRDMGIAPPSFNGGRPPLTPQPLFEQGVPGQKINPFTGQPVVFDPSAPSAFQTPPPLAPPMAQQQSPFAPPETANFAKGPGFLGGKIPLKAPPIDKRNDFMSIAQDPNALPLEDRGFGPGITRTPDFMRPGSGITDNRQGMPFQPVQAVNPQPAPQGKMPSQATLDALEELRNNPGPGVKVGFGSYGPGGNLSGGPNNQTFFDTIDNGSSLMDRIGGPVNPGSAPISPPPTNGMPPVNPNITGVTQPDPNVPVNPITTAAPGIPVNPNSVDPVLQEQVINENVTDPLLRSMYFGNENEPGFYNQLQTAGANLIGSDVPTQATAGLDPLEQMARNQAVSQSGDYQSFLDQAQDQYGQGLTSALSGIDEAKQLASQTTDVFARQLSDVEQRGAGAAGRFADETRFLEQRAAGDVGQYAGALGESEDLLRGTLGGYDQRMTGDFYNPYEDQVVQQTIDDVMKAGDKQDIAARAQAIGSGAFGGSRARLGADERREALGRGLGQALGNIRSGGFQQAQQAGMGEFARQQNARRAASSGLGGLAGSRLGAQQGLSNRMGSGAQQRLAADKGVIDLLGQGAQSRYGAGSNLASNFQQYGQNAANARSNMGGNMLNIGGQGFDLGARSRQELTGLGQASRGIQDIINQRQYTQTDSTTT